MIAKNKNGWTINTEKVFGVEGCLDPKVYDRPECWVTFGRYKTIKGCLDALKDFRRTDPRVHISRLNNGKGRWVGHIFRPVHVYYDI